MTLTPVSSSCYTRQVDPVVDYILLSLNDIQSFKVVAMFIQSNNIDLFVNLVSFDGRLWKFRFSPRPKV